MSNVEKFLEAGGLSQPLYTQKYVDEKDKEIERLENIILQIYEIFEKGRFEDNCDCIQIEEIITREIKGEDKE